MITVLFLILISALIWLTCFSGCDEDDMSEIISNILKEKSKAHIVTSINLSIFNIDNSYNKAYGKAHAESHPESLMDFFMHLTICDKLIIVIPPQCQFITCIFWERLFKHYFNKYGYNNLESKIVLKFDYGSEKISNERMATQRSILASFHEVCSRHSNDYGMIN